MTYIPGIVLTAGQFIGCYANTGSIDNTCAMFGIMADATGLKGRTAAP